MTPTKKRQTTNNLISKHLPPEALRPIVVPILKITTETPKTKVFTLFAPNIARTATPGQFMMVWIPGTDEIPMSISSTNRSKGYVEFAAARVGEATSRLHEVKENQLLGLRGPLGQGFRFPEKPVHDHLLLVAGGCGAPPLVFATQIATRKGFSVHVVLGAATKEDLLFQKRFNHLAQKLILVTDDGSEGMHGTTVDAASFLLNTEPTYVTCFACGPEGMLYNLSKLLQKYSIPLQVSLERYMKCGVGLCGHCIIDTHGTRVCHEGPVFNIKDLKDTDFGKWTRDSTGKRQPIHLKKKKG